MGMGKTIWVSRKSDGEVVCGVCGTEKFKVVDQDGRGQCCETSPFIRLEEFLTLYFGEGAHTDPSGPKETYVPHGTLKEFYEDYRLGGHQSLDDYIAATISEAS